MASLLGDGCDWSWSTFNTVTAYLLNIDISPIKYHCDFVHSCRLLSHIVVLLFLHSFCVCVYRAALIVRNAVAAAADDD